MTLRGTLFFCPIVTVKYGLYGQEALLNSSFRQVVRPLCVSPSHSTLLFLILDDNDFSSGREVPLQFRFRLTFLRASDGGFGLVIASDIGRGYFSRWPFCAILDSVGQQI